MLTIIKNAQILTPDGWIPLGAISFADGRITSIQESINHDSSANVIDAKGAFIVPGFIDMHVHGGGGRDFLEGSDEAFRAIAQTHLLHGTTAIYPTLAVAPFEIFQRAILTTERLMNEPHSTIMGLHLEGPYLNPTMAGGQEPQYICLPEKDTYRHMLENTSCIKRWDAAPEVDGALEFGRFTSSRGLVVSVAHTTADYKTLKEAHKVGYTHATHFYNAMTGVHKKREFKHEGTIEGIYLIDDMSVELIADGIHVPAAILQLVYKIKGVERTALVTDAMHYAAAEDLKVDNSRIIIEDGVCKLADRSALAGSIATMDHLVRTMVGKAEIPLCDAVRMASETPARIMGIYDRKGSLEVSKDADMVMLDKDLNVVGVWSMGNRAK